MRSGRTPRAGHILELPYKNSEERATAELTALVGARAVGEHRHPALVERFTELEGELRVKLAGQTTVLREGKTAVVEPGVWRAIGGTRATAKTPAFALR